MPIIGTLTPRVQVGPSIGIGIFGVVGRLSAIPSMREKNRASGLLDLHLHL